MARPLTTFNVYKNGFKIAKMTSYEIENMLGISRQNISKYYDVTDRRYKDVWNFVPEEEEKNLMNLKNDWNRTVKAVMKSNSANCLKNYIVIYKKRSDIGNYTINAKKMTVAANSKNEAMKRAEEELGSEYIAFMAEKTTRVGISGKGVTG